MKQLCILADDLTGANEIGLQFTGLGYSYGTLLFNRPTFKKDLKRTASIVDLLAIDGETRLETPKKAYNTSGHIIKALRRNGGKRFYLKCDSTLRGNIGTSIHAALNASGGTYAAVCFAFPAAGRITINGVQYVYGKELTKTEFGKDRINPVRTSYIPALIRSQSGLKCGLITLKDIRRGIEETTEKVKEYVSQGVKVIVFDSCKDTDLQTVAASLKNCRVFCGASAMAKYLLPNKQRNISTGFYGKKAVVAGPVLGVIGSSKRTTLEQCKYAIEKAGLKQMLVSDADISIKHCPIGQDVMLRLVHVKNTSISGRDASKLAEKLGRIAASIIKLNNHSSIYMSGGTTALGVCREMGIGFLIIKEKVCMGIPLVYSPERKLFMITKSGGLGKKDALYRIYKTLKNIKSIKRRKV